MFCDNENCSKKRFAGTFEFVNPRGKMTKRLEEEILKVGMNMKRSKFELLKVKVLLLEGVR